MNYRKLVGPSANCQHILKKVGIPIHPSIHRYVLEILQWVLGLLGLCLVLGFEQYENIQRHFSINGQQIMRLDPRITF